VAELGPDQLPPVTSLWLVLYSSFLAGVNFVMVIPTADDYARRLGGDEFFSGLMIGTLPLAAMVGIFVNQYLLRCRLSFKAVLLLFSVGSIVGNMLYALAGLMHFKWTLLAGRFLVGLCNGFNLPTLYISLTVGMQHRSRVILYFSAVNILGYAAGPALASALDAFLKSTRINDLVLDVDTVPGWFMVAMYLLYMVKLILLMEDLPVHITALKPPPQAAASGGRQDRFSVAAACVAFWYCLVASVAMTMIEVYTVRFAKQELGWSVSKSGLVLAALMFISGFVSMATGKVIQRLLWSDRGAALGSSLLGSVACVAFFACSWEMAGGVRLAVLGTGLLLTITVAGLIRGFGLALSSKLAPAHMKSSMNAWAVVFLTIGRGAGGIIGSVLQPTSFASVMLGMFGLSLLVSVVLYSHLKAGAKAS
jgi:MFS family permease